MEICYENRDINALLEHIPDNADRVKVVLNEGYWKLTIIWSGK